MSPAPFHLGDVAVFGPVPAKLAKAIGVIAQELHPALSRQPGIVSRDKSKESCILCSLAVRDFLHQISFKDAEVRTVVCYMQANKGDELLHSLCIGYPGDTPEPGRWVGHMVVLVPSANVLIDTTLYPSNRPQWPDLPGMIVAPIQRGARKRMFDRVPIAGLEAKGDDGYEFGIAWFDDPDNWDWMTGGDAYDEARREPAVKALRKRFGKWKD